MYNDSVSTEIVSYLPVLRFIDSPRSETAVLRGPSVTLYIYILYTCTHPHTHTRTHRGTHLGTVFPTPRAALRGIAVNREGGQDKLQEELNIIEKLSSATV